VAKPPQCYLAARSFEEASYSKELGRILKEMLTGTFASCKLTDSIAHIDL
jgi:hypothetical protein